MACFSLSATRLPPNLPFRTWTFRPFSARVPPSPQVACLSLGLPEETVHQTFTALRDAPESEADGTVAMVRNGSTTEDHGAEEDAGGSQGVTNPAATFAASE